MNWIKVLITNIAVLIFLLGLAILAPPVVGLLHDAIIGISSSGREQMSDDKKLLIEEDSRALLSVYRSWPLAKLHFIENNAVTHEYFDFIVWKPKDFSGQTINIKDGNRLTVSSGNTVGKPIWFFGGSTVFGVGTSDDYTVPSLVSGFTNRPVVNFGRPGYSVRQQLEVLENRILDARSSVDIELPTVIMIVGGVDVLAGCKSDSPVIGTFQQARIRKLVDDPKEREALASMRWSFRRTFDQLLDFLGSLARKVGFESSEIEVSTASDCSFNRHKAQYIAEKVIKTLKIARVLSNAHGLKFHAFLEPVIYMSSEVGNDMEVMKNVESVLERKSQIEAVYPFLIESAGRLDWLVDVTAALDGCDQCYIDDTHKSSKGNTLLAEAIMKVIIN